MSILRRVLVVVQHVTAEGAPVCDPTTTQFEPHPKIDQRRTVSWTSITTQSGTVVAGAPLLEWAKKNGLDTLTNAGSMTNNCILTSVAESETCSASALSSGQGSDGGAGCLMGVGGEAPHPPGMTRGGRDRACRTRTSHRGALA